MLHTSSLDHPRPTPQDPLTGCCLHLLTALALPSHSLRSPIADDDFSPGAESEVEEEFDEGDAERDDERPPFADGGLTSADPALVQQLDEAKDEEDDKEFGAAEAAEGEAEVIAEEYDEGPVVDDERPPFADADVAAADPVMAAAVLGVAPGGVAAAEAEAEEEEDADFAPGALPSYHPQRRTPTSRPVGLTHYHPHNSHPHTLTPLHPHTVTPSPTPTPTPTPNQVPRRVSSSPRNTTRVRWSTTSGLRLPTPTWSRRTPTWCCSS